MSQFIRKVGELPQDIQGAMIRALQATAERGVAVVVEQINSVNPENGAPPPVDEGTLMRSVHPRNTPRGAVIVVDAPHAPHMEYGTRPHFPPLKPLIEWAIRKFGVSESEARGIAWVVAKKISEDGLAPRHYMKRAMAVIRARIVFQEMERELRLLP